MKEFFQGILAEVMGKSVAVTEYQIRGGGCINSCYRLRTPQGAFFIKYHQERYLDMFEKEYEGLIALKESCELTVPQPLGYGISSGKAFLLMEFLESTAPAASYWKQLGQGLAHLHRLSHDKFGWSTDNYIGRLPQKNSWTTEWVDFFVVNRLHPQIALARNNQLLPPATQTNLEKLIGNLNELLILENAALLHGDLWSGNVMVGPAGQPCIMDPATYYGHREIELAFTTLFGGFDKKFYQAYQETYPLQSGFESRFEIYNLYPLLVHLNLFGSGYLGDIQRTLKRYC